MSGHRDRAAVVDAVREDLLTRPGELDPDRVARVLSASGTVVGARELLELTALARDHLTGLGDLQDLARPGVTDLLVNPDGSVWEEDGDGLRRTARHLDPDEARSLAVRLATSAGRRLDDASPFVDARLPGGARLHALLPPLSTGATALSLRFPARHGFSLTELGRTGMVDALGDRLLRAVVRSRAAFVVSGGTGTGKTTLLAAMLGEAPARERIIVLEDSRELEIDHPHVVSLQSRPAGAEGSGGVDLVALVRQSLRMRPDRLVLGECRGAEVRELLQALNTGHEGGCGTVHANAAADVPARLEALGALGGLDPQALATQAVSALDLVVHLGRHQGRRRLVEIARLRRGGDGLLEAVLAVDLWGRRPHAGPAWGDLCRRIELPTDLVGEEGS